MESTLMGIVVEIGEIKAFPSGFMVRHVIIDTGTSHSPNPVKIDCRGYEIEILDSCKINDVLEIRYHLQGKKYEGRYFVSVIAEQIRRLGDTESNAFNQEFVPSYEGNIMQGDSIVSVAGEEDIPF